MMMDHKMKDYFQSQKYTILISSVCTLLSYFLLSTSTNIRMDTDVFSYAPEEMLDTWLTVGRFGLVFVKIILMLTSYHPLASGLIFIFFMILTNITIGYFLYIFSSEKKYPYWLFLLLFGTSQIWSYQVYFILQEAEIAFVCFLVALVAGLMVKHCFFKMGKGAFAVTAILSIAVLVLSFGTYQSFVYYYVTLCLTFFTFMLYHQHSKNEVTWGRGVMKLIAHFVIALGIYWLIANKFFMTQGAYLTDQIRWGKSSLKECIWSIVTEAKRMLTFYDAGHITFYPFGIIAGLCAIYFTVIRNKEMNPSVKVWLTLSSLATMAMPLACNIIMGALVVPRMQFCLQISAAFLALFSYVAFYERWKIFSRNIFKTVCIAVILLQIGVNFRLYYTDEMRFRQDMAYVDSMGDILAEYEKTGKPVIFLGIKQMNETFLITKSGDYGYSFFEWGDTTIPADANAPAIRRFIKAYKNIDVPSNYSQQMLEEATAIGADMDVLPEANSILEMPAYVIIKLSDY